MVQEPLLPEWADKRHVVIGMLHAPPLPGSPRCPAAFDKTIEHVLRDVTELVAGGVDGLMLENFGDVPFTAGAVAPVTVAALTRLATEVRHLTTVPLGINVLRNDAQAALSIAVATGARFIRVNILSGIRATDQGLISGDAHQLLRLRSSLSAESVRILADVDVKHSAPVARRPLSEETEELVQRAGADAVIVSGPATGKAVNLTDLPEVVAAAGNKPVLVGSGVTLESLPRLLPFCHGMIVGSGFKPGGNIAAPIERARVTALMQVVRNFTGSPGGR